MEIKWNATEVLVDGIPLDRYNDEQLEEARIAFFDKWNWETGSEEDLRIFEAIEQEIERRKSFANVEEELLKTLSKEITQEIDNEIIQDILRQAEAEGKLKDK